MFQVDKNVFRGPRPTIADLKAQGISIVVCLESGVYSEFHDDDYTPNNLHLNGFLLYEIPMSDITPPSNEDVAKALRIIKNDSRFFKVYVHCLSGKDRTGYVCAAYRFVYQAWSLDQCLSEMISMGQHWWFRWWNIFFTRRCNEIKYEALR